MHVSLSNGLLIQSDPPHCIITSARSGHISLSLPSSSSSSSSSSSLSSPVVPVIDDNQTSFIHATVFAKTHNATITDTVIKYVTTEPGSFQE